MSKSLLFIPDISGYTKFIQNTEVEHSQHVIAELLEVLIAANTQDLKLAEVEGDALFFYKVNEVPSQEKLLAQIESMYTAFYSHLKMMEKNRICPCNACATAPNLELKIIAHSGEMQFLEVQGRRKPFGEAVIQAHRLLKNSVPSDNYVLISEPLAEIVGMPLDYESKLFRFRESEDSYDEQQIRYGFSEIDIEKLKLSSFSDPKKVEMCCEPNLSFEREFSVSAETALEYVTNYRYRHLWNKNVDSFEFAENEVTRLGSEHTCVIDGKHLDFVTVTKEGAPDEIVYGELTTSPPPVDKLYNFFIFTPLSENRSKLRLEIYWTAISPIKKMMIALVVKKHFKKGALEALAGLEKIFNEKAA